MKYPKIVTVYKRDPANRHKTLLEGQFALPEFEYLAQNQWVFTEKIDGTNIRVQWKGYAARHPFQSVIFQGRTDNAQIPPFLLDKLSEIFPLQHFDELYPGTSMTLYGEGYGARIQKGGGNYIPDGVSFILFDVLIGDYWLKRADVEDIAKKLEIDVVPIVGVGTLDEAVEYVRYGFKSSIGTRDAEGLVMRPQVELRSRRGHRIITKIKCKDFPRQEDDDGR